ncbi:MAG: carbamoyl-phosphate synthase large subunit [Proteobacteria bacterium]|jgi:carbamoyl-phosphate synthase large subunit|nr:carbamoyl-phosphate synthase large subunit [Alphaproteobacteria bacterium]NCC03289.1 carbamoyl-phosphate synthase large subunit [Pseudomonadota bacterium]
MPKRTDIKSICIIGAGPIVIGQACEFDYSGVQACKALRSEGYRIILINSNPATIMTDPDVADATYVEPITPEMVAKVLEKERPDALLPTMGGQTALNTSMALAQDGTLARLNIELIGAKRDAIEKAEDRLLFRNAMDKIGLESPKSHLVHTMTEALEALTEIGLPAIIRPSFTLAGTGGGIAYNRAEFNEIVASGLDASPINEVLIEESVLGWKEYEMEVVRDGKDNCIIICSIENVDPMGIHTGDSITVAPALTLTDKEYQVMRNASIAVLREIGVDTGGSNVQFAVNPVDGRMVVIEMNPRVSRSSALASKATGFPIAKVAAKLAVGYTLDELLNDITGVTPASFEPTIDYVVTKVPRFAFEKFPGTEPTLTTAMKSVGEVMAIGRTFQESLQKALRGLETGLSGLNEIKIESTDGAQSIHAALAKPSHDRILVVAQALRMGVSVEDICAICKYDPWFIRQIDELVREEASIKSKGLPNSKACWYRLKSMGFSDLRLAQLTGSNEIDVGKARRSAGVLPVFKRIDTCAAEFGSLTPYLYSTYESANALNPPSCEAGPSDKKKVIILGGGPNRIGQGIEFDYCCVHAVMALREAGYEAIMINCNPETVSTDYDTSDRLYFEPLTGEDVMEIIRVEQSKGTLHGVVVQFGGQTPLRLASTLERAGVPILGTSPDAIDLAEDRERFQVLLKELCLLQPANGLARSGEEAEKVAESIGYPVVIRPSYVLGGRAMEIVHAPEALRRYIDTAVHVSGSNPVLIDYYLQNAIEVDVDVVADTEMSYVAGVMEHIEEAGIHSGDSSCALPPYSLPAPIVAEISRQAQALAKRIGVVGLMNVQFAVKEDDIYILEVNPRASRTVPFVAKAIGLPIAKIAARVMAGENLSELLSDYKMEEYGQPRMAVKTPVFPFARFAGVDTILGPEMKSTGEVMGLDRDFAHAYAKAQLGAGLKLPKEGTCFVSVKNSDKEATLPLARRLVEMGFKLVATGGTAKALVEADIPVQRINKVYEGQPHVVDSMINGDIQLMINTTASGAQTLADSFSLRRTALMEGIPHYTTMAGARAAVEAISALRTDALEVSALQSYPSRRK